MRILVTSDWQCSVANLHLCQRVVNRIVRLVAQRHVNVVLHLGDVKDAFNPVDQRVTNFLIRATQQILTTQVSLLFLAGNHDRITTSDGSESCMPVLRWAGAYAVEQPEIITANKVTFCLVPFHRDRQRLLEALRGFHSGEGPERRVLCFHNEVRSAKLSVLPTVGNSAEAIPLDALWPEEYAVCLGGHIHHQQKLGMNVWYAGSSFHHDWREVNASCGFLLVEVDERGSRAPIVERIPSRLPGFYDPELPGFHLAECPSGSNIRVRARYKFGQNPTTAIEAARRAAAKQYAGHTIHVVPVLEETGEGAAGFQTIRNQPDNVLIRDYLAHRQFADQPMMESYLLELLGLCGVSAVGLEKLRFLEVTGTNALCFERIHLPLAGKGVTTVVGENRDWDNCSNGSGKTSALVLPAIALCGRNPKGQSHDAWSRRGAKGPSELRLRVMLADGRVLEVRRGRRPAVFQLLLEGKDVTGGTVNDTQRILESMTRLVPEVLENVLYLGQREVGTILTGTDKERRELFSRLLGLDRFLRAQEDVRKDLRRNASAQAGAQAQLDAARQQQDELQRSLEALQRSCGHSLDECAARIATLGQQQQTLRVEIETGRVRITQLRKQTQAASEKVRQAAQQEACVRAAREELEQRLAQIGRGVKQGAQCYVCGATVTKSNLHGLHKELEAAHARLGRELDVAVAALRRAEKADQATAREQQKADEEQEALRQRLTRVMSEQDLWQARLADAQRTGVEADECRQRARSAERAVAAHTAYLEWLERDAVFLRCCESAIGRDGLPMYLCETLCPDLNAAAARLAAVFTEGRVGVAFALQDGQVDIQIENPYGGAAVSDQSQGELRMVGLITAFALREVLVPYNLLILDEPGEGLDAVNARRFAQGLQELANSGWTLFVVTHNPHILAELEPAQQLRVVKHHGVSRLEVAHGAAESRQR